MKKIISFISLAVLLLVIVGCDDPIIKNGKFTVKFDTNTELRIADQIVTKGVKVTKPTDPVKDGYTFDGWYLGDKKWVFDEDEVTSDITLTARFVRDETELFNLKGSVKENDIYKVIVPNSNKSYNFKPFVEFGGYSKYYVSGDEYGSNIYITKQVPLIQGDNYYYILCEKDNGDIDTYRVNIYRNHLYRVKFNTDTDTAIESKQVEEGTILTNIKTVTKEGYTFKGWDYDFTKPITCDLVVNAMWEIKKYTITYELDGGVFNTTAPTEYTKDSDVTIPTLTKEGWNFIGWAIDSRKGIKLCNNILPGSTKKNVTLYAIWQIGQTFSITYLECDIEKGEFTNVVLPTTAPKIFDKNGLTQLPTPTKENKNFGGWYFDKELSIKVTAIPAGTAKNVILYARWENLPSGVTHNITYDTAGGTLPADAPATFDEAVGLWDLPVPTKEGYNFAGWNKQHITAGTREDVLLTAIWKKVSFYKITYVVNDGKLPADVPTIFEGGIGVELVEAIPNNPTKDFLRWEDEKGNVYDRINPNIYKDVKLIAVFGKKGVYKPKWELDQIGFQGKGMIYEIKVDSIEENNPFDPSYTGSQKVIKQQHQTRVEAAYDIIIKYTAWEDSAPWGPERVKHINKKYMEDYGDVYVVTIASQWIPTLVKGGSIAELYNMTTETGVFTELSYDETKQSTKGYIQDNMFNQATSVKGRVYGYSLGNARPDYFMYYNVDKVKNLNLEDPAELWMKGEWTISKFSSWVRDAQTKLSKGEYVLDMGFAESIIGLTASTGNQISCVNPPRLFLTNTQVTDIISFLQEAYASGLYYGRGVQDVSPGFQAGSTILHHGDLWFLKESTRFNPLVMPFTIGVVPYPTADGQGGTPVTTTDVSKAIKIDEDKYLTDAKGNYIETVDMSNSTFKVPYTGTRSCYAVLNIENGKNGINAKVIMNILHDLVAGLGDDPNNTVNLTADESYRNSLEFKFDREIDIEVIMSCQDNTYFELMELLSMTVGGGSHFGDGGFWPLAASIVKKTDSPVTALSEVLPKYKQAMRDLGYNIQ